MFLKGEFILLLGGIIYQYNIDTTGAPFKYRRDDLGFEKIFPIFMAHEYIFAEFMFEVRILDFLPEIFIHQKGKGDIVDMDSKCLFAVNALKIQDFLVNILDSQGIVKDDDVIRRETQHCRDRNPLGKKVQFGSSHRMHLHLPGNKENIEIFGHGIPVDADLLGDIYDGHPTGMGSQQILNMGKFRMISLHYWIIRLLHITPVVLKFFG